MICGRPITALCAVGALLLPAAQASARQATAVWSGHGAVSHLSTREVSTTVTWGQGRTKTWIRELPHADQAPRDPQTPRPAETKIAPQGFSVVLVIADLTAESGGDSDVPPAAQRALADIKDFLPYKSYKLLDAAWLLGQGHQTIRLRGPEEQQYELRLVTPPYASDTGRLSVQFVLREAQDEGALEAAMDDERMAYQRKELEDRAARLRAELADARKKREEARIRELETEIAALPRSRVVSKGRVGSLRKVSVRPMIETSFTMDVGETVVVGTSRLKENSGAIIALLTAVPPRGGSPKYKESR